MSTKAFGAFVLLFFIIALVFTLSFQYISIADSDNETSVKNSSRNAMTEAINLGNARVNEEITINPDAAIESVVRQYASTSDFFDGDRQLNVYQVKSDPAMIAVDSYLSVKTPMNSMLNKFTGKKQPDETEGRSREIVIFEAKSETKPQGGQP